MTSKTKIATTSGLSIMMFAALMAPSMQTANAGIDICNYVGDLLVLDLDIWDTNFVSDPDTGDFIFLFKCYIPDVDCVVNDANNGNFIEEVPKKSTSSTTCSGFIFASISNVPEAIATDSVPAEWDAIGAGCVSGTSDVKGSKDQGATVIECESDFDAVLGYYLAVGGTFEVETRENPGKGHKEGTVYKPTSCELFKNEGAEGFVPGRTYDHDSDAGTAEIPFSTGLTNPLPVTVVGPGCDT